MKMEFPDNINKILLNKNYHENTVGKTDSKVFIYDDFVLKVQKTSNETKNEFEIMRKLNNKLPIPKIIEYVEQDGLSYTLMSRIKGEMLSEDKYTNDPDKLINLLCEAFKLLWSIDTKEFYIDNASNIHERLKVARYNVENNLVDVNNVMPETFGSKGFSSPKALLEWLENNIPKQDLAFTHGDFCFENIFVKNSHINGFIDLGKAGVADRWQDLAICIRELDEIFLNINDSSYKKYLSDMLLEKLGIEKNDTKLKYYMLLDELF